jgi:xanthine dehydrogenase iron-sulfur cluster and FAD-binding subunit A
MVADALVHLAGPKKERTMAFTDLYVGYRQLALQPGELITAISFKVPKAEENLRLFKVSQRRDLDISTVNSAFLFSFNSKAEVKTARICYGGVGATVLRFAKAEDFLVGKTLSEATITAAIDLIQRDMAPLSDVRGTAGYRRALVDGLIRRYCAELLEAAP